LLCW